MRGNIIIAISIIAVTIAIFINNFPRTFISELSLSFTPYIIIGALILVIINLIFLRRTKKHKKTLFAFMILLLGLIVFLYGNKVTQFYIGEIHDISEIKNSEQEGLKVMFANIFFKNTETNDILKKIQQENPDVVALVEFSHHHRDKIYEILKKDYPYTNINQRSKIYAGNIIFSKYPIKNLLPQTQQGERRYNYIAINYNDKKYYLYVVHTTAPISPQYLKKRNQQLIKISNDIKEQTISREQNAKIIMVGDFNITPRSAHYQESLGDIPLKNITRSKKILFTRKNSILPFLYAHIDHVFVSKNITTKGLKTIDFIGSDHKGLIINGLK